MAKRKDNPTPDTAAATEVAASMTEAPAKSPKPDAAVAAEATPAAETTLETAPAAAPEIKLEAAQQLDATTSPAAETAPQLARRRFTSYVRLAAGLALAVALGALAGAGATAALLREPPAATADGGRAMQDTAAQLNTELSSVKTSIASAQRAATAQFNKLVERLDRADKAQAEPAARLAKLQDAIEKLEHRLQQAATDVTGSVTAKQESKPPEADGWRLRDYYAGRAVVESRDGTLFEIGPGSRVPGLGKVETIKRDNGHVVVVTSSGTITAALDARRPRYRY